MFNATSEEFANANGVDYGTARGILEFMMKQGTISVVTGVAKKGKGKPAKVYAIPETATFTFNAPKPAPVAATPAVAVDSLKAEAEQVPAAPEETAEVVQEEVAGVS